MFVKQETVEFITKASEKLGLTWVNYGATCLFQFSFRGVEVACRLLFLQNSIEGCWMVTPTIKN